MGFYIFAVFALLWTCLLANGQMVPFGEICGIDMDVHVCPNDKACIIEDKPELMPSNIGIGQCYCDANCQLYQDCCVDYFENVLNGSVTQRDDSYKGTFECLDREDITNEGPVYVVTKCPHQWENSHVRSQCEEPVSGQRILNWPVSDDNRILYKNIFCAECHETKFTEYWTLTINCVNPELVQKNMTLLRQELRKGNCKIQFVHPNETNMFRLCNIHVGQCPESYEDDQCIKSNCENSIVSNAVISRTRTKYKNGYCAICNNETSTICPQTMIRGFVGRSMAPGFTSSFYPLSLVVDLNSGNMDFKVGLASGGIINETVMEVEKCPENHVYDIFEDICIAVNCAVGYTLSEGSCVSIGGHRDAIDCLRTTFTIDEYDVLNNGSIYINDSEQLFLRDMYVISLNGSALVCTNFIQAYNKTYTIQRELLELKFDYAQTIFSVVGQILSIVALTIHLVVYLILPQLWNPPGKNLMSLVVALLSAQLLFLVGTGNGAAVYGACVTIAIIVHFCFLAAFFWMNVMSFDIWCTFSSTNTVVSVHQHGKKFVIYSIYGWGVPTLILLISIIVNYSLGEDSMYRPGYGEGLGCWISYRYALLLFFGLPLLVVIISNCIMYTLTLLELQKISKTTKMIRQKKTDKKRFYLYIKLSGIMGLTWIFGFIATLADKTEVWYIFLFFNTLQGLFICITFVCTKRVLRLLKEKFHRALKKARGQEISEDEATRNTVLSSKMSASLSSLTANQVNMAATPKRERKDIPI